MDFPAFIEWSKYIEIICWMTSFIHSTNISWALTLCRHCAGCWRENNKQGKYVSVFMKLKVLVAGKYTFWFLGFSQVHVRSPSCGPGKLIWVSWCMSLPHVLHSDSYCHFKFPLWHFDSFLGYSLGLLTPPASHLTTLLKPPPPQIVVP